MEKIKSGAAPAVWQRNGGKDITLNVSFQDALIRFGFTALIPIVALFADVRLIIYTAPVIAYLFVTSLCRFCVIKYLWHYLPMHRRLPVIKAYGKDPNYPEETI